MAKARCTDCGYDVERIGSASKGETRLDKALYSQLCKHLTVGPLVFDCPKLLETIRLATKITDKEHHPAGAPPRVRGRTGQPTYTTSHTSLSDNPNDYVFRCDGIEIGRCYLRERAGNEQRWLWTIYIGMYAVRRVEGIPISGDAETLELAKADFRFWFEQMILAGVVNLPGT